MIRTRLLAPAALLLLAGPALAHVPEGLPEGPAVPPWFWTSTWTTDPLVLWPLLAVALGYLVGIVRLWRRAGAGRGVPVWRASAFALGLAALFVALVSHLDAGAETSFALHMTQHMLLIVVAAPLVALGNLGVVLLAAFPGRARIALGRLFATATPRSLRARLFAVPLATALHGAVIWLWHAPGLYELALERPLVHWLEHVTMFGTGALFWWSVLSARRRGALGEGAGIAALFLTMLHTGLLGILITLAPAPLYASYAHHTPLGLSALEDQQLAGIVMLLPGGLAYLAGGLALLAAWLNAAERRRTGRRGAPA